MSIATPQYDRGIVPAEVAARKEREGEIFGRTPKDERVNPESIDTTSGYTVDQEGLVNNYAVEPEMYINEPGDLSQQEAELAAKRARELEELAEDGEGRLTMERDTRHKGQGLI